MNRFKKSFDFVKESEQVAFGVFYPRDFVDTQNEYTDSRELAKAVERLSANENWPYLVDKQHDLNRTESRIIESYLAESDGPNFRKGDWVRRVKIDDSTWAEVESGNLRAFSIYGKAKRLNATFNGKPVQKMVNLQPTLISLVSKGANKLEFVRKSDDTAPAWFAAWEAQIKERIDDLVKGSKVEKAQAGDYVKRAGHWYRVLNPKTNTLEKLDSGTSARLGKAHNAKLRKESGVNDAHADYIAALHAIPHDGFGNYSPENMHKISYLQDRMDRSGGGDAVWTGLFDVDANRSVGRIGGDTFASTWDELQAEFDGQ